MFCYVYNDREFLEFIFKKLDIGLGLNVNMGER